MQIVEIFLKVLEKVCMKQNLYRSRMQQIYKFKNIVAILYLFSSCTAHDMLGTNRSCMKSCTWPPNCVQRRVQWAVQWFTEVQRTSRGQDHMMRGGRVREMLAVIEGHKSGAKIKIFAHVHPTSQGSLLSWQNKASHSRSWMTLNISSCCFITLTSCCWESVLEHDTRQRGWQEARLRSLCRVQTEPARGKYRVYTTGQLSPGSGLCCPDYLSSGLRPDTKQWNVRYTCLTQTSLLRVVT